MKFLLSMIVAMYLVILVMVFCIEAAVGPVTPALAAARAILWPLYVTTGIPQGQRARMD